VKIIFCGYRGWSLSVFERLKSQYKNIHHISLATDPSELKSLYSKECDLVLAVGWSWRIDDEIIENCFVAGMHPSNLPEYAGGSPIQHQVIDGIINTKATLFRLRKELDSGEILDKEDLTLNGQIEEILSSVAESTFSLLVRFIDLFPNVSPSAQSKDKLKVKKRLKPENGKINLPDGFSCETLWNFIRCRGGPYPSAYFEDETGKIEIQSVRFTKKSQ